MIEIVRTGASAAKARVAIFDFDGTLSLIRSGWMSVMVPLCIEELEKTNSGESHDTLRQVVEDFVWRLTGKETIYQMMALADAVTERGGTPEEPICYKKRYLDRLMERIQDRLDGLRQKTVSPDRFRVPGTLQLLQYLRDRGVRLYLASGTDDLNVKEEASLLGIAEFFEGRIYGAHDDLRSFSKALLVNRILSEAGYTAEELVVFGDGYVEIEEVKKVGGTAVGVATLEPDCMSIDSWKRERLIRVGADFIVPNLLYLEELADVVFEDKSLILVN